MSLEVMYHILVELSNLQYWMHQWWNNRFRKRWFLPSYDCEEGGGGSSSIGDMSPKGRDFFTPIYLLFPLWFGSAFCEWCFCHLLCSRTRLQQLTHLMPTTNIPKVYILLKEGDFWEWYFYKFSVVKTNTDVCKLTKVAVWLQ